MKQSVRFLSLLAGLFAVGPVSADSGDEICFRFTGMQEQFPARPCAS